MQTDRIEAVGIDQNGSLWVKPATAVFPYIYRETMEVGWDPERGCLVSPKPREWSYTRWCIQIKDAALAQGVSLIIESDTSWHSIDADLRQAMMIASDSN